jgi:transposase
VQKITRVGVDLAKQQIQVHAVDAGERVVVARSMRRDKFAAWCAQLPAGCIVAMEACSSGHHWARQLLGMGLAPRLIAAHFVTPYRMEGKGGKNDAADAAAICEAASRPKMRFVPVKSCEQQGTLTVHRLREGYKEERNACISRIRGLLAEFGLVFAQGPKALREQLAGVLEDATNELTANARLSLDRAFAHWRALDAEMAWCDQRIAQHAKSDAQAQQVQRIVGIGPTGASAVVASVGDFRQFRNAGQFAAWLGLVPRQNSSGGKTSLGRITKRGDDYLRISRPRRTNGVLLSGSYLGPHRVVQQGRL